MNALLRQEPGDPRAKVIEAMARALCGTRRAWEATSEHNREFKRQQASDCLAALEAQGWGPKEEAIDE